MASRRQRKKRTKVARPGPVSPSIPQPEAEGMGAEPPESFWGRPPRLGRILLGLVVGVILGHSLVLSHQDRTWRPTSSQELFLEQSYRNSIWHPKRIPDARLPSAFGLLLVWVGSLSLVLPELIRGWNQLSPPPPSGETEEEGEARSEDSRAGVSPGADGKTGAGGKKGAASDAESRESTGEMPAEDPEILANWSLLRGGLLLSGWSVVSRLGLELLGIGIEGAHAGLSGVPVLGQALGMVVAALAGAALTGSPTLSKAYFAMFVLGMGLPLMVPARLELILGVPLAVGQGVIYFLLASESRRRPES